MAFFGLTTLGASDPIREGTAISQTYVFHELSLEQYHDAFNAYLLGDSETALLMEVDGSCNVLRASLGDMLKTLLGRQPRKHELQAWFTFHDFDRTAILGLEEYSSAVDRLIQFSAQPNNPNTCNSYDIKRAQWLRSTRTVNENQQTFKAPLTTGMEMGWHVAMKSTVLEPRKTLNSTDVTLREGHTAASYFGML